MNSKTKKICVFAPHPDDETLGCGGYLFKLKKEKVIINLVFLTKMKEDDGYSKIEINKKNRQIKQIIKLYNFDSFTQLDYSPSKLDKADFHALVQKIHEILNKLKPDTILMPHSEDIHTDHSVSSRAILSASKIFRNKYLKRLLVYETLSETEYKDTYSSINFVPNFYVDISRYIEKKIKAMSIYKGELMQPNYPRSHSSIKALSRYRGSKVLVKYAEAYMQILDIEK